MNSVKCYYSYEGVKDVTGLQERSLGRLEILKPRNINMSYKGKFKVERKWKTYICFVLRDLLRRPLRVIIINV